MSNILTYTLMLNDRMSQTLTKVGASTDSTTREVRKLKGEVDGLNKVSLGGFLSTMSKVAAFLGVGAAIGKTIRTGMEQEMMNTSFEVLLGGVEPAKRMIDDITTYAAKAYGQTAVSNVVQLMKGSDIAADEIMKNIRAIGDISAGNAGKFQSLSLAFSQMSSNGRLFGQDLNQMINAGFNPLIKMSEKTGKSVAQLKEEMAKGLITSQMVKQVFYDVTEAGGQYHGMIEKIANTAGGQWQQSMSLFNQRLLDLYKIILPYLVPALKLLNQFLADPIATLGRLVDRVTSAYPIISGAIIGITAAWVTYRTVILSIAGWHLVIAAWKSALAAYEIVVFAVKNATSLWAAAQWLLNVALNANPIGVVIGAVAALIAAIVYAYKRFDWFRGGIMGVWEVMKLFIKYLKDSVMNTVKGLADMFTGLGKIISSIFKGDWEGIKAGAKMAGSGLLGASTGITRAAAENGSKIGDAFRSGYDKAVGGNKGIAAAGIPGTTNAAAGIGGTTGTGGTGGMTGKAGKDTASSIATGGTKTTNITITLDRLVDTININRNGFRESAEGMRDMVLDEMTRVLLMAQGQV